MPAVKNEFCLLCFLLKNIFPKKGSRHIYHVSENRLMILNVRYAIFKIRLRYIIIQTVFKWFYLHNETSGNWQHQNFKMEQFHTFLKAVNSHVESDGIHVDTLLDIELGSGLSSDVSKREPNMINHFL